MSVVKIPPPSGVAAPGKHYYKVHDGVIRSGPVFEIDIKYELQELLGVGASGTVCSAVNTETNEKVAIKMIEFFEQRKSPWRKILRELTLLRQIDHPFIIDIKDVMKPSESQDTFKNVYIVLELMKSNLSDVLTRYGPMSTLFCKMLVNQLLRALKYLHSGNVVHRDVKPCNILVDDRMRIKLCDFGLSRIISAPGLPMTPGFGSIPYMSPEQCLISTEYTAAVDIWAVGCVFARVLQGKLLFNPLKVKDQIKEIVNVIPRPKSKDLDFVTDKNVCDFLDALPNPTTTLREKIPIADPAAIDLLEKMLVFDPRNRITAPEALRHPYMGDITLDDLKNRLKLNSRDVSMLNSDIPLVLEFDSEEHTNTNLTENRGRAKVHKEILLYHGSENNDYTTTS